MRIFMFIFLFTCMFVQSTQAQEINFYDGILESVYPDRADNLIALDIVASDYKGKVIIENANLALFLKEEKTVESKNYATFVKTLLANKTALNVCNVSIENSDFIILKREYNDVDKIAKKGKKAFLKHFFNGSYMKSSILREHKEFGVMYAVAIKLFEWRIATYVDDRRGLLAIYNCEDSENCKQIKE